MALLTIEELKTTGLICHFNSFQIVYEKTDIANQRGGLTLNELLAKIKRQLVERVVFTRNKNPFQIGIAELPLIIPSATTNTTSFNTEMDKKSIHSTSEKEGNSKV